MKQENFVILQNRPIARDVRELVLSGDVSGFTAPGQFAQVRLDGFFLRRPISLCSMDNGTLTLVYKEVGAGTKTLGSLPEGTALDLLTGLGNGYDLTEAGERPLLLGGGVGVPPLYELAKRLSSRGARPLAILGFNTAEDVFYVERFAEYCDVTLVTADGSEGERGFVTDVLPAEGSYGYFYACGPSPMLRAVSSALRCDGQLSLEERMACGFGACVGCTIQTKNGARRVCKDGPVFRKEELIW